MTAAAAAATTAAAAAARIAAIVGTNQIQNPARTVGRNVVVVIVVVVGRVLVLFVLVLILLILSEQGVGRKRWRLGGRGRINGRGVGGRTSRRSVVEIGTLSGGQGRGGGRGGRFGRWDNGVRVEHEVCMLLLWWWRCGGGGGGRGGRRRRGCRGQWQRCGCELGW